MYFFLFLSKLFVRFLLFLCFLFSSGGGGAGPYANDFNRQTDKYTQTETNKLMAIGEILQNGPRSNANVPIESQELTSYLMTTVKFAFFARYSKIKCQKFDLENEGQR